MRIGRLVHVLGQTSSTNDEVLARADDRAADGLAVLAEQPGTPLSARAGPVLEFSEHPTPIEPAAELGSHTEAILQFLGYSDEAIADLDARGITRGVGNTLPV